MVMALQRDLVVRRERKAAELGKEQERQDGEEDGEKIGEERDNEEDDGTEKSS